tara:strand:+ start:2500 stop:3051 length:552 start_codon:yes stop_codon:yes gene_type:complete
MIVMKNKQAVIYTPPRCASTTLWSYFGTRKGLNIAGASRCGNFEHHYNEPLIGYTYFRQIVVIRKPLDRLVSLYRFLSLHKKDKKLDLDRFVDLITGFKWKVPLYCDNQHRRLENVNVTHIVRFEHLTEDFVKLGLVKKGDEMPKLNPSPNQSPTADDLTDEQVERLMFWWLPDCKRFGVDPR